MANPIAVPGTVVSSGAAVSPGGAQGPTALSANANNKATLGTDSLLLVQGTAAGVAATTHAQTVSGDDPQLTNARTPTAHEASHVTGSDQIPLASSSTKGLLNQTSGNTTDFIDGTNNSQALQPVIWSVRLRSYNAISNPNFEVDQRNVGGVVTSAVGGAFIVDRWFKAGNGTYAVNCRQVTPASPVVVPGTNFAISSKVFQVNLQTAQATLAAGDFLGIRQLPEGIQLRELISDVHSISLLVQSTVAPLSFAVALRDAAATPTRSLVKLCTITTANTWTLITLPNLPVWPAAGTFNITPGAQGYDVEIVLACGSTNMAPSADVWNTGNFIGAPGMSNFCNNAVNSLFQIAFIQHEPGALCTTLQDLPFSQNYDACLRYYTKSYPYGVISGTAAAPAGRVITMPFASQPPYCFIPFKKTMAKTPTIIGYSDSTGAINTVRDATAGVDRAISTTANPGDAGFCGFTTATVNAASAIYTYHYTADTGW